MSKQITVDPMTRIEGHLKFQTRLEKGVVTGARTSGEMFRGIEKALIGHDARVAQQVTQRVCGVCPYAHAEAASLALESAMGIRPNPNGQRLRNLIVGAYQLQDYILHFYHLSALDFIDIAAVLDYKGSDRDLLTVKAWVQSELKSGKIFPAAPFFPRYEAAYAKNKDLNFSAIKHYVEAFRVMADLHKMVALFGGKAPHPVAIEAGGVTTMPTMANIAKYKTYLGQAERFITEKFYDDLVGVATAFKSYFNEGKGYGNYLSYPYLPDADGKNPTFAGGSTIGGKYEPLDLGRIFEDHTYSYYSHEPSTGVKPMTHTAMAPLDYEAFKAEHHKPDGKYSWTKSPRYRDEVVEVGPVARIVNTYHSGANPKVKALVDGVNKKLGIGLDDYNSVMGRHLCRFLTGLVILDRLKEDIDALEPDVLGFVEREVPKNARGYGLTEASRGALGHWIETDDKGLIRNYEMIVPTTWNIGPKDAKGRPGAVEKMLIGTKIADGENPIEMTRIVRSTDPCIACSVH